MNRIIISVTNDLATDQRVTRTCDCFNGLGYEILLIGRRLRNSPEINRPYKTCRFRLVFNKGFMFYAEYNIRLFLKLLFSKKDVLYANDLDTLLPNFLMSRLNNCKLIYDSHEYFTEVPELRSRPVVRNFWLNLEALIFPKLKNVITVNQKLAEIYTSRYKVPVTVIRNLPMPALKTEKNDGFGIRPDQKIILYQGALNMGRGLELMIDATAYLNNHVLVFAGDGDLKKPLMAMVEEKLLEDKVTFLGRLRPSELLNLSRKADIGLSLEEDLGLNYRYCLPNKVFDYINAGIPVLVSNLPLLKQLVLSYGVGEILIKRNPEILASTIERIIENKAAYQEALRSSAYELNWQKEQKILIEFIKTIE